MSKMCYYPFKDHLGFEMVESTWLLPLQYLIILFINNQKDFCKIRSNHSPIPLKLTMTKQTLIHARGASKS